MTDQANVHLLRVFTDSLGRFGSPASVVVGGADLDDTGRLAITRQLATDETVFIDDPQELKVRIFSSIQEVPFAGQPVLGAAWLVPQLLDTSVDVIHCPAGDVHVWFDGELTWVRAKLTLMPPWNYLHLANVEDVERIVADDAAQMPHTMVWAWLDQAQGLIRARTFATDWGMPETQGNGSGCMALAATLGHDIRVTHGDGSDIHARLGPGNCADVGGRVGTAGSAI